MEQERTRLMHELCCDYFLQAPRFDEYLRAYRPSLEPVQLLSEINQFFASHDKLLLFNFVVEHLLLERLVVHRLGLHEEQRRDVVVTRSFYVFGIQQGSPTFAEFSRNSNAMSPVWREIVAGLPGEEQTFKVKIPDPKTSLTFAAMSVRLLVDGRQVRHWYHHGQMTPEEAGSCLKFGVRVHVPLRS